MDLEHNTLWLYENCCQFVQAIALAAAEAIAALVVANIVGALTAKKSGRKAYGK